MRNTCLMFFVTFTCLVMFGCENPANAYDHANLSAIDHGPYNYSMGEVTDGFYGKNVVMKKINFIGDNTYEDIVYKDSREICSGYNSYTYGGIKTQLLEVGENEFILKTYTSHCPPDTGILTKKQTSIRFKADKSEIIKTLFNGKYYCYDVIGIVFE